MTVMMLVAKIYLSLVSDPYIELTPESRSLILREDSANTSLLARYAGALEEPSGVTLKRMIGMKIASDKTTHNYNLKNCTWSGYQKTFISFTEPGNYDIVYEITVRGRNYSGSTTIIVSNEPHNGRCM